MTDYVSVNASLPNIVSRDLDYSSTPLVYASAIYQDFVERCALEHPSWEFRLRHRRRVLDAGEKYMTHHCVVFSQGEEIGDISAVYYRDAQCVRVNSEHGTKTSKHFDIAKKAFDKLVRKKTVAELVIEAVAACEYSIGATHQRKFKALEDWSSELINIRAFTGLIAKQVDEIATIVKDSGSDPNIVRSFVDAIEELEIVQGVKECLQKKTGAVVLLLGQRYVVTNRNEPIQTYEEHDVPDIIKRQVGMLKLVEVGQFITNIGAHARENTFYITRMEVV